MSVKDLFCGSPGFRVPCAPLSSPSVNPILATSTAKQTKKPNVIVFLSYYLPAAYKCHGGWKANGTTHQIIGSDLPSPAGWRKLYCVTYVRWPPDHVHVSVYADNCNTANNRTGTTNDGLVLSFNISLSPSGKSPRFAPIFGSPGKTSGLTFQLHMLNRDLGGTSRMVITFGNRTSGNCDKCRRWAIYSRLAPET